MIDWPTGSTTLIFIFRWGFITINGYSYSIGFYRVLFSNITNQFLLLGLYHLDSLKSHVSYFHPNFIIIYLSLFYIWIEK